VKFLRDWLNTNPQLQALFEANLSTEVRPDEINESEINAAACAMNMNSRESSTEKTKIENLKISFTFLQDSKFFSALDF